MKTFMHTGIFVALLIITILLSVILPPAPILAENATGNTTYVALTFDDFADLTDAVDSQSTAFEEMNGTISSLDATLDSAAAMIFELLLMIGVTALALWKRQEGQEITIILNVVSGLVLIFIGILWVDSYAGIAAVLIVFGCYQLFAGLREALSSQTASTGLSRFKSLWKKIRRKK